MKKVIYLPALLVCFFCIPVIACAQDNTPSAYLIVFEMAAANRYEMTPAVGYGNAPSKQYQLFQKLVKHAPAADLVQLVLNHNNAVVRLYAFQALKIQKAFIPDEVRQKMGSDKNVVVVVQGCTVMDGMVHALAAKDLGGQSAGLLRPHYVTYF